LEDCLHLWLRSRRLRKLLPAVNAGHHRVHVCTVLRDVKRVSAGLLCSALLPANGTPPASINSAISASTLAADPSAAARRRDGSRCDLHHDGQWECCRLRRRGVHSKPCLIPQRGGRCHFADSQRRPTGPKAARRRVVYGHRNNRFTDCHGGKRRSDNPLIARFCLGRLRCARCHRHASHAADLVSGCNLSATSTTTVASPAVAATASTSTADTSASSVAAANGVHGADQHADQHCRAA